MIRLEDPGPANFLMPWKAHYIAKGPDVIFKSIPCKGGLAVFCTEFFRTKDHHDDPRIAVRQSRSSHLRWRTQQSYHEVEWHDFNRDGWKDMLTVRVNKDCCTPVDCTKETDVAG